MNPGLSVSHKFRGTKASAIQLLKHNIRDCEVFLIPRLSPRSVSSIKRTDEGLTFADFFPGGGGGPWHWKFDSWALYTSELFIITDEEFEANWEP